jgi:hypothetical protein
MEATSVAAPSQLVSVKVKEEAVPVPTLAQWQSAEDHRLREEIRHQLVREMSKDRLQYVD